jgi:RNA polymerase sigma-70 factor (ECF subfamily)
MNDSQDRLLVLLLAHRGMLLGYITSIVREPHLAEDVFQNMALVVLKKGHVIKEETQFPAWARKVARLEALTALRKRKNSPELLDQSVLDLLEDHWPAGDNSPHAAGVALRQCMERLAPRARRLIELRYIENVRPADLSAKFARPINTIYVALSRTYRLLATCVKERLAREGVAYG